MGNPTYKISRYISIYHCDESGNIGSAYMLETQLISKISEGKPLTIKTIEPTSKDIELGIVMSIHNYKKNESITIRTEYGWWHIKRNENLEILLGSPLEWGE